jgi:hypothetical protein
MRPFCILVLSFLLCFKPEAQNPNFAWTSYDTSSKIDIKGFSSLTKFEIDFIRIYPEFSDNRARLTLSDTPINRISPKELQHSDFPLPCHCLLKNDTIYITTALGLTSGLGIVTIINKENFGSAFFQEADHTNVFKQRETDSTYTDRIMVGTEGQKLTLFRKPGFVSDEFLTGTFEARFGRFYELDFGTRSQLTRKYRAKMFFKCKVQPATN